jgi:DNA-binding beta-propeller fold protein YncE
MNVRAYPPRPIAGLLAGALAATLLACAAASARAGEGFGEIKGPGGCLAEVGASSATGCTVAKGLFHPKALAVSPDGTSIYVVGGVAGNNVAESFGVITILKRNPATGEIAEAGCLSSDGTDGREGASGICNPTPSLLGAYGVTVSADGRTVFVTTRSSASVVAFARNPATGSLTRLGCFQATPRADSPCTSANLFPGSEDLLTSAEDTTLYVASPLEGTISAFTAPPATSAQSSSGEHSAGTTEHPAPAASEHPSEAGSSAGLASLFTAIPGQFTANPCIAVNGYDGACAVGIAMKGVQGLTLSPEGKQLYAVAAASHAIDVFAPSGKEGSTGKAVLTETGCLMADAPAGLCSSSGLLQAPTQLAVSPDGRNVYVADRSLPPFSGGRIDVLSRDASTGQLADVSCIDYQPPPPKPEPGEEEEREGNEEKPEKEPTDPCQRVPGLEGVQTVAVSGDGSAVYAFGASSAISFARNSSTGALTETACASESDPSCASLAGLTEVDAATVSPDGRYVYVTTADGKLLTFGTGAAVASASAAATHAGLALVPVACPSALSRSCRGRLLLTRVVHLHARGRRHDRAMRIAAGHSSPFAIAAGRSAFVAVRLNRTARRLLLGDRHLHVTATVHGDPFSGGSGFGRRLVLRLRRRDAASARA